VATEVAPEAMDLQLLITMILEPTRMLLHKDLERSLSSSAICH